MIKVISHSICPFVQRVTAALEAMGMPYEIEFIELSVMPDWFLEISPNGQVPVLVTNNGVPLFESDAIVEYLDEITPPLERDVTPEQRALDRAWAYQATKHYLPQCSTMSSRDEATFIDRNAKLQKLFAKAEEALGNGPFFKGETLSNVDIAWLPLLHRANIVCEHTGFDFVADYPKVSAWQQALVTLPVTNKSVSPQFEERFTSYYLSEATHLGRKGLPAANSACCAPRCCA